MIRFILLASLLALSACSGTTKPDDIAQSATTLGDFSGNYENVPSSGFSSRSPDDPPPSEDLWESLLWAVDFQRAQEWRSAKGTVSLWVKDENTMVARLDSAEAVEAEIVLNGRFQDQGFHADSQSEARIFVILNSVSTHDLSFWLDGERRLVVTHDYHGIGFVLVLPLFGSHFLVSRHAYGRCSE